MALEPLLIIFIAKYLIFFLFLSIPYLWFKGHRLWVFKTVVAVVVVFALSELIKHYFYLPRPFVAQGFNPLVPHEPDGSFPSSHTSLLAAYSASLFFLDKRWAGLCLLGAILVGFGRVAVGIHYGIDVFGGLVLGILVTPSIHRIGTYFVKKY